MRLEAIILGSADLDRSKAFYEKLGWRLDIDVSAGDAFRIMQFMPPGSDFSIQIAKGAPTSTAGAVKSLYLVVPDIEAARKDLMDRGVAVEEIYHASPGHPPAPGADPEHHSYGSFARFSDPDDNGYLIQEITKRLPGRGGPELAAAP